MILRSGLVKQKNIVSRIAILTTSLPIVHLLRDPTTFNGPLFSVDAQWHRMWAYRDRPYRVTHSYFSHATRTHARNQPPTCSLPLSAQMLRAPGGGSTLLPSLSCFTTRIYTRFQPSSHYWSKKLTCIDRCLPKKKKKTYVYFCSASGYFSFREIRGSSGVICFGVPLVKGT